MPVKLSRTVVYQWKKYNYLGFADKLEQAQHEFREYLEDLALKYLEGTRPGQNPTMLIAMLNASWPEKWRRNEPGSDDAKEVLAAVRFQLRQLRDGSTDLEIEAGGRAG